MKNLSIRITMLSLLLMLCALAFSLCGGGSVSTSGHLDCGGVVAPYFWDPANPTRDQYASDDTSLGSGSLKHVGDFVVSGLQYETWHQGQYDWISGHMNLDGPSCHATMTFTGWVFWPDGFMEGSWSMSGQAGSYKSGSGTFNGVGAGSPTLSFDIQGNLQK